MKCSSIIVTNAFQNEVRNKEKVLAKSMRASEKKIHHFSTNRSPLNIREISTDLRCRSLTSIAKRSLKECVSHLRAH